MRFLSGQIANCQRDNTLEEKADQLSHNVGAGCFLAMRVVIAEFELCIHVDTDQVLFPTERFFLFIFSSRCFAFERFFC